MIPKMLCDCLYCCSWELVWIGSVTVPDTLPDIRSRHGWLPSIAATAPGSKRMSGPWTSHSPSME